MVQKKSRARLGVHRVDGKRDRRELEDTRASERRIESILEKKVIV